MHSSWRIGRIAGIEVRAHYTWLFAFALITWSLAAGYFPANDPSERTATYWLLGVIAALALFASVLLHELSHSLVATARGLRVRDITLFIFGGVSTIEGESKSPTGEILVAVVGPLASLMLAGLFWAIQRALAPGQTPVGVLLGYLALVNLLLGAFNLLPGFPLDGGRVLRGLLWALGGSPRSATLIASYVGQAVGFLLILSGLSQFFGGQYLNGLWIGFIGWFLNTAAEATRRQQVLTENLRGVTVAEVMDPTPPSASPTLSVQEFVHEQVVRRGHRALLVLEDERLLGLVSVTDAKELPQNAWADTPVSRIMTPVPLRTVALDAELSAALRVMAEEGLNQVPVVRDGRVLGLLSRADILRFIQLHDELALSGGARAGRPTEVPAERGS